MICRTWVTITALAAGLAVGTGAARAGEPGEPGGRIVVAGVGSVRTPPDRAIIQYAVRGEGATSDAAVRALVAKRAAVEAGLASLGDRPRPTASRVTIAEVRSAECRSEDDQPRLSIGACAIAGYVANLVLEVRTAAVRDAGTMVGLIGRLGGTDPSLGGYGLADDGLARRQAMVAALADAKRQAATIAQGAGARLGRMLIASNAGYGDRGEEDIVVTGSRPAAAPTLEIAPITVDLTPKPIETQARITVTYAIDP